MKVVVIGANGQLGGNLVSAYLAAGETVIGLTHTDIEISEQASTRAALLALAPDVIVNTAAMHHVERCEQVPATAFAVNALGAKNLALTANELGALLIHVSTDYVFDGRSSLPYTEADSPLPLNVYGNTKLAGEYFIRSLAARHQVVRTSGLYGKRPCRAKGGLNFVELMLKLGKERGKVRVVDDEFVSPTFTGDLAEQMVTLSQSGCNGLFHATAEGSCSWFQFASEIFSLAGTQASVEVATPGEFPTKVARPKYSVLENQRLKHLALNRLQPWRDGLRRYLGIADETQSANVA